MIIVMLGIGLACSGLLFAVVAACERWTVPRGGTRVVNVLALNMGIDGTGAARATR
ncbi:hypothetical protein ACS8Y6_00290 [Salinisphaera sp. RV14]|uniref:hypothetical protein n=1 Tax=unclassified Salinisphaera TaxID=2649847 RepID=UPI003F864438